MPDVVQVRGFRAVVDNTRPDIATVEVLQRFDEALALIEQYQPWRLRHLRRDLAQFWIVRYACRGAYFPAERACMTELTFLARRDITAAPVASSIVHEGIHARDGGRGGGAGDRLAGRAGAAGGGRPRGEERRRPMSKPSPRGTTPSGDLG